MGKGHSWFLPCVQYRNLSVSVRVSSRIAQVYCQHILLKNPAQGRGSRSFYSRNPAKTSRVHLKPHSHPCCPHTLAAERVPKVFLHWMRQPKMRVTSCIAGDRFGAQGHTTPLHDSPKERVPVFEDMQDHSSNITPRWQCPMKAFRLMNSNGSKTAALMGLTFTTYIRYFLF